MISISEAKLSDALRRCWSLESSSKWTKDNPALEKCSVTALVVHDYLGGEILKTNYGGTWHFYNRIDGRSVDFTESQFDAPIEYSDYVSSREEAFTDTNPKQYSYGAFLRHKFRNGGVI